MSVISAANFVIQSITHLARPPVKTTYHTDEGTLTTYTYKGIVRGPFCKWYRSPIWWWKMRHMRRDILLLESEVAPEMSRRMRELEDQAFLNGSGA